MNDKEFLSPSDTWTNKPPYYLSVYSKHLIHLRDKPIKLLELGVHRGGSLEMWGSSFPNATIAGIDIKPVLATNEAGVVLRENGEPVQYKFSSERIQFRQGSQSDAEFLTAVSAEIAPDGWDVIIDDASHVGSLSLASFKALFPRLKKGGLYIVEDWGVGYLHNFAEGARLNRETHFTQEGDTFPSHQNGIVGFVKQFVDELSMGEATREYMENGPNVKPTIAELHYYVGVCIARKA